MHRYLSRGPSMTLGWIAAVVMCAGGAYGVWYAIGGG